MKIEKNTIVSLRYKLSDAQNNIIEEPDTPMVYLHGGYSGTFPKIESLLDGKDIGFETTVQLEPQDAFGEYDPNLLKIEPRERFPEPLEIGMQFEGVPEEQSTEELEAASLNEVDDDDDDQEVDTLIYTVTDLADKQVVLDGNHPLAGMALRFWLQVEDVRQATEDEIENQHPQGEDGFGMDLADDDDLDDLDLSGTAQRDQGPRTLH
ncbi:MAG: peptidylprolyl isomerase [Burkholderiaceae bacterium]|nr:peptidylprolyl isomerase [Burkholderiaceae bacterium]